MNTRSLFFLLLCTFLLLSMNSGQADPLSGGGVGLIGGSANGLGPGIGPGTSNGFAGANGLGHDNGLGFSGGFGNGGFNLRGNTSPASMGGDWIGQGATLMNGGVLNGSSQGVAQTLGMAGAVQQRTDASLLMAPVQLPSNNFQSVSSSNLTSGGRHAGIRFADISRPTNNRGLDHASDGETFEKNTFWQSYLDESTDLSDNETVGRIGSPLDPALGLLRIQHDQVQPNGVFTDFLVSSLLGNAPLLQDLARCDHQDFHVLARTDHQDFHVTARTDHQDFHRSTEKCNYQDFHVLARYTNGNRVLNAERTDHQDFHVTARTDHQDFSLLGVRP
ncbi:MAG: hypothetical protein K2X77_31215 [Candidatus Obscuribacterales bacterium]|jgi:hypothetical protein|nr:hypothetical protein [Candidatus Obscuribacterales bacterium]